tara:strand:+ start:57 stop:527 length:471 start_codon:yes stop_codon:yes gene_type:complete
MNIINTQNLNEVRKQINTLVGQGKEKPIIVMSQDDDFNRKILENKHTNVLIINEGIKKNDYMKQRDSSLNEILCKIATKNNIKIAIDISSIIKKNPVEKAKALARLKQNIDLCKRTKTELIFFKNSVDKRELSSLLLSLGASTSQAKKAAEESFFN